MAESDDVGAAPASDGSDTGHPDTGHPDTGHPDAGHPEAGRPDAAARADTDGAESAEDRTLDLDPDDDVPPLRRTHNRSAAAMIAAGMFALDELLGRKPREQAPIVVDANGEPVDIDTDGIEVRVATDTGDEVAVAAPALPRTRPLTANDRAGRRRGGRRR